MVGHQPGQAVPEIGVHHHGVSAQLAVGRAHADGPAAFKHDFLYGRVELDVERPILPGHASPLRVSELQPP